MPLLSHCKDICYYLLMARVAGKVRESRLLVISSDEGFCGRVRKLVAQSGEEAEALPLAGVSPAALKNRRAAAIVDCRSLGGVAQSVVEKLRKSDKTMPILAVIKHDGRDICDQMYGCGATLCISEDVGETAFEQMITALARMRESQQKIARLSEMVHHKSKELRETLKDLDGYKLQLTKRVQEQITVYRASRAMLSVFNFDALANEIVELATRELGAEVGSLMLIDGDQLVVRALSGHVPGEDVILGRRQRVGEGISGWVAREGKPLLITDIDKHPTFNERGGVRYKTKSCVSCPIIARGRIRGVVNITNKKGGGHFIEDDLRLLRTLAMTAAVALDNFELIDQIKRAETMSSIGELATRMAHEIRNPLHAIKMTIQILEKKFHLEESDQEYYDIVIGEIERLEALVREVLYFAKQDKLELTQCDVTAVLERILSVFKGEFEERQIQISTSWDEALPLILADERKLEQALMNLVVNGIEAMKPGGRLRLFTRLVTPFLVPLSQYGEEINEEPEGQVSYIHITVSDDGVGIEKNFANRIFTPFFTTKVQGTGLGLSTTRKIVEAHGGKLTYESEPGVGATFRVELPLKE